MTALAVLACLAAARARARVGAGRTAGADHVGAVVDGAEDGEGGEPEGPAPARRLQAEMGKKGGGRMLRELDELWKALERLLTPGHAGEILEILYLKDAF